MSEFFCTSCQQHKPHAERARDPLHNRAVCKTCHAKGNAARGARRRASIAAFYRTR